MQELINNCEDMLTYLDSFASQAPGMSEDMFQEAALIALELPRPLNRSQLYRIASQAAVAVIREEIHHHPK